MCVLAESWELELGTYGITNIEMVKISKKLEC